MRLKAIKKSKGQRGETTHGHGARKKWKGSGHRGGIGMAGTGKRADQKKTLVLKKYGNKYFGKQGVVGKSTERKKIEVINLRDIQNNLDSLKKHEKNGVLVLKKYRVLGEGELRAKLKIEAKGFTSTAREKIEKAGGEAILIGVKKSKPLKK